MHASMQPTGQRRQQAGKAGSHLSKTDDCKSQSKQQAKQDVDLLCSSSSNSKAGEQAHEQNRESASRIGTPCQA